MSRAATTQVLRGITTKAVNNIRPLIGCFSYYHIC
jgi:hypothetical protein